jgi:hypothetical protein
LAIRPRAWRPWPICAKSAVPGLGAPPLATAGRLVGSGKSAWLPAPSSAVLPSVHQPGSGRAAKTELASQLLSFFHVSGDQASQLALCMYSIATSGNCDMSVVDRQNGRWYVKDIRASMQPMRIP